MTRIVPEKPTEAMIEAQARKALLEELIERVDPKTCYDTMDEYTVKEFLRSVLEEE